VTTDLQEIPLPPDALMIAVSNHANHEDFARSRMNGPAQMLADLTEAGIDHGKLIDTLDFGCGCGRFLAGWVMRGSPMRLRGCDYNPVLVQWCSENIPGVQMKVNHIGQPVPFAAGSLDFVYLLSVFTHLTVAEQKRLVADFRRLLRPGGYVYVTFHGEYFHPEILPRVEGGAEIFKRDGFLIQYENLEGQNDCWTLHSPGYLSAVFDGFRPVKHFRSLDRGPTDIAAWQDSMIFQLNAES
jgi:SAM-dependent methyltransferase